MAESQPRQPSIFLCHGGGPCFFMELQPPLAPDAFDRLATYLRGLAATLPRRPEAVLVVSGHWEAPVPTVNSGAHPPLLFDYYGFPEHTYRLEYPAPGSPKLAAEVRALLEDAGIATADDDRRGYDHGVFVPFLLVFPEADIPIVQLSLEEGLDPARHLAIGRALRPLRERGVLIVGSGMSYHNLGAMFRAADGVASERFDAWLAEAATAPDERRRERALAGWEGAPSARDCHPRAEHLLPLMVVAGAAGADPGARVYQDHILGKALSGFQYG